MGVHHHHWLDRQQNARWVNITIAKCHMGEHHHCKMPGEWTSSSLSLAGSTAECQVGEHHHRHHWLDRQQNARWVNITIAITGWIDSKMPGGWTSPLQNARWVNITITKCQVGEHHHYKMPGGWTSPLQNARWMNIIITITGWIDRKMAGGYTSLSSAALTAKRCVNIVIAITSWTDSRMPGGWMSAVLLWLDWQVGEHLHRPYWLDWQVGEYLHRPYWLDW